MGVDPSRIIASLDTGDNLMNVGFIGVGQMGKFMAGHILEAGYPLTVHDLNPEAASSLIKKGAHWAASPAETARQSNVIITSLPAPRDVEKVVFGSDGLAAGWKAGDDYIDMSTNSPTLIKLIASEAAKMNVAVLDAPVSGGTAGAEKGSLSIIVGGDAATLQQVRPVLETMGKKIFPVGAVGCGNIAKLVNNLIALATNAVTAEGFVLGVKAGIDPGVLFDILKVSTANSWSLEQFQDSVFKNNFEPGFKLALGRKDMALALTLAEDSGLTLQVGRTVQQMLDAAIQAGLSEKSVQSVIVPLEEQAGVQVRRS